MAAEDWKTRVTKVQKLEPSGPAGAPPESCLVMIYPAGAELGKRFELDRAEVTIGRGADCTIVLDRDSVSRKHARLDRGAAGEISVSDLGSTNGTYVNDDPVQTCKLKNGDLLKIGNTIFKFISGNNVEAGYHEEIYRMTIVDGLTQAHNKRYLMEFLEREQARSLRYGRPLSVAMFDLDHFKQINDRFGHLTGDFILRELVRRLRGRIRKEELLARYGGEEFVCVLPEAARDAALDFGEQIRKLVAKEPFVFEGERIAVTISVGIATQGTTAQDPTALLRAADENLYKAKRAGRNQVTG